MHGRVADGTHAVGGDLGGDVGGKPRRAGRTAPSRPAQGSAERAAVRCRAAS